MTTAQELKHTISSGLLSFPLTDFDAQGEFDAKGYAQRLEWLAPYGASALFAAGGTGEFFSLVGDEYGAVIRTAVGTCRGKVPIIAGTGGPTRQAIAYAQEAQRLGAQGLPVYSSAVFNFIPRTAMDFYRAVADDERATQSRLLDDFFLPYLAIRNRRAGYAVSIVKAGAALVGHSAGPVRTPLTDLTPAERDELGALLARLGAQ